MQPMNNTSPNFTRIMAMREGGAVERCHTIPHIGEYSNAKHSFNAACLILVLHPEPNLELVKAVMLHDIPERWLGDLPAPAKWYNESLNREYEFAEQCVRTHWAVDFGPLTEEEKQWLDGVDKLEFYLWCWDQYKFGNQHICRAMEAVTGWFEQNMAQVPDPIWDFYQNFLWERLPSVKPILTTGESNEPEEPQS